MIFPNPRKVSITSLLLAAICFSTCYDDVNGFLVPTATERTIFLRGDTRDSDFSSASTTSLRNRERKRIHMMPVDITSFTDSIASSSFHLSDVAVFDGSSIVDPVVVSNSFWSGLQRQFLSIILGQFFATVVFGIAASFFSSQLSAVRDAVLSKFNDGTSQTPAQKPFVKADALARPAPDFGKLVICLLIDIVGTSSEALPILGEFTDILTAPAAALLLQNLYPGSSKFVFAFEFAEEILPLTDFIPFATICWVVDTYFPESSVADVFQLGNFSAVTAEDKADSIDTSGERISSQDIDTKR